MIWLNGILLPAPRHLEITQTDTLGKCRVNALGGIVRDVLGVKKRITLRYQHLKDDDARALHALLKTQGNLVLRYPDMNGEQEIACRVGGKQLKLYHTENASAVWADITVILEEV